MDDHRMTFGSQLRTIRRSHHLTQEAVTDLSGGQVGNTQISRYENGVNLPPHRLDVEALAYAMGCSVREKKLLVVSYAVSISHPYGIDDLLVAWKEFAS